MKTHNPRSTLKPRITVLLAALASVISLAAPSTQAATITQSVNSTSDSAIHWMGAIWGSPAAIPSSGNDYISDGAITSILRTGSAASGVTFPGTSLTLRNGVNFLVKRNASANYIAESGAIFSAGVNSRSINGTLLVASPQTTTFNSGSNAFTFNALISGSGVITVQGSGIGEVLVTNPANTFDGAWIVASGTLVGAANGVFGDGSTATLTVAPGGKFALDTGFDHTFYAVTLDGVTLPSGTYGWSDLSVAQQAFFLQGNDHITVASAPTPPPVTYYQVTDQASTSGSWSDLSAWNTAIDGTGSSPTALNPWDEFICNRQAWVLRSPTTASTFPGGTITIGTQNHAIMARAGATQVVVPSVVGIGTPSLKSGGNISNLRVNELVNNATFVRLFTNNSNNSTFTVSFGSITGAGDLDLYYYLTNGLMKLTVDDAANYLGDILVGTGKLEFQNNLESAGGIVIPTPANITLNNNVTFTSAKVNGTDLSVGNHTASSLGFVGSGTLTVRVPTTWYLTANQTAGQDWSGNWIAHWNANSGGTGTTANSINILDEYIVSGSGRLLRTPSATSTFRGGKLSLGASATLQLTGGTTAISTVPNLVATGGTIATGSSGTRNLASDKLEIAGAVTLNIGAAASLNLFVYDFKGAGSLTIPASSGTLTPAIDEGNGFTGTITVNSGATVHFAQKFAIAGSLNVSSTSNITVDDWVYITGLTVGGVTKSVGTYTAASLGWSGTGSVTVYTRDLAGPPQMFGVNLAGAEFTSAAYWPTNPATWDYYQGKGLTLIRLPFDWERVQSSLYGAANFTKLDECIALASARGMKVILDIHSYNQYRIGGVGYQVGSPEVPHSALADVWFKIADHFKNESTIYGYDIMNEPKGELANWNAAAQLTVDAIRKADTTHYVLVEGMSHASARQWKNVSAALDVHDPAGRLIYSAHSYWDYTEAAPNYKYDGSYRSSEVGTTTLGIENAAPFVEWLKTRPYAHGNFGEYGTPNNMNTASWNLALDGFLAYLRANNISGTYWAGGSWGSYQLLCEPRPLTTGPDQPQMAVLQAYNNISIPAEIIVDNTSASFSGSWTASTQSPGYYGSNYHHDGNTGKGAKTATFTPNLSSAGAYKVFMRWPAGSNLDDTVPVTITHSGGTSNISTNQKLGDSTWVLMGIYDFASGTSGNLTIGTTGTTEYVVADAVKLIR
jgi:hypothetical protein